MKTNKFLRMATIVAIAMAMTMAVVTLVSAQTPPTPIPVEAPTATPAPVMTVTVQITTTITILPGGFIPPRLVENWLIETYGDPKADSIVQKVGEACDVFGAYCQEFVPGQTVVGPILIVTDPGGKTIEKARVVKTFGYVPGRFGLYFCPMETGCLMISHGRYALLAWDLPKELLH